VQHRVFVVLIVDFALFEWRVRTGRVAVPAVALVFPLVTAVGAALPVTHLHALENVKEQLLIKLTHVPLALLGVLAGWTRWRFGEASIAPEQVDHGIFTAILIR
jgi:copper resistance protein D